MGQATGEGIDLVNRDLHCLGLHLSSAAAQLFDPTISGNNRNRAASMIVEGVEDP